ncbi:UNVERIFIED_CONTAM: hypothetical protein Sindi_2669600 [Sesamum indicum]
MEGFNFAWDCVCLPNNEGGQGNQDITASTLLLWELNCGKDPCHELGPFIRKFPNGPSLTNSRLTDRVVACIEDGQWRWPLLRSHAYPLRMLTDIQQIMHSLPHIVVVITIFYGQLRQRLQRQLRYFPSLRAQGPKVGWSSLLLGPFKIPRHTFVRWLAILGKLSTMDRPWLSHLDSSCVLFTDGAAENHNHLFFHCSYSRSCLQVIRLTLRFPWPNRPWPTDLLWAASRWKGKHMIYASYRALLGSLIYHI